MRIRFFYKDLEKAKTGKHSTIEVTELSHPLKQLARSDYRTVTKLGWIVRSIHYGVYFDILVIDTE